MLLTSLTYLPVVFVTTQDSLFWAREPVRTWDWFALPRYFFANGMPRLTIHSWRHGRSVTLCRLVHMNIHDRFLIGEGLRLHILQVS